MGDAVTGRHTLDGRALVRAPEGNRRPGRSPHQYLRNAYRRKSRAEDPSARLSRCGPRLHPALARPGNRHAIRRSHAFRDHWPGDWAARLPGADVWLVVDHDPAPDGPGSLAARYADRPRWPHDRGQLAGVWLGRMRGRF